MALHGAGARPRAASRRRGAPPRPSPRAATTAPASPRAGRGAAAAALAASASASASSPSLLPSLVDFFRQASPYIAGFRGRTFVVVLPGEVVADAGQLDGVLADVALVHSLGARLVLVAGCGAQATALLAARGAACGRDFACGLRVTPAAAMAAVAEAAGAAQLTVAAALSRGPGVAAARRHGGWSAAAAAGGDGAASAPAPPGVGAPFLRVACGNFVAARRAGVLGGVDMGDTGVVRWVDAAGIHARLQAGDLALLSNLGFSPAGEVLNCSCWEVAAAAALALRADKLVALTPGGVLGGGDGGGDGATGGATAGATCGAAAASSSRADPTPAGRVRALLGERPGRGGGAVREVRLEAAAAALAAAVGAARLDPSFFPHSPPPPPQQPQQQQAVAAAAAAAAVAAAALFSPPFSVRPFAAAGVPAPLAMAVAAVAAGVPRSHLLDSCVPGALLLELFTVDGCGLMVWRGAAAAATAAAAAAPPAPPQHPQQQPQQHHAGWAGGRDWGAGGRGGGGEGGEGGVGEGAQPQPPPPPPPAPHFAYDGPPRLAAADDLPALAALLGQFASSAPPPPSPSPSQSPSPPSPPPPAGGFGVLSGARLSPAALAADVAAGRFAVLERDGALLAAASLTPHAVPSPAAAEAAVVVAELGSFCVAPAARGAGRGTALLAWLEARASTSLRATHLYLLTTEAADWFTQRGFQPRGRAADAARRWGERAAGGGGGGCGGGGGDDEPPMPPPGRPVDPARNSLLFVKRLGRPGGAGGDGGGGGG